MTSRLNSNVGSHACATIPGWLACFIPFFTPRDVGTPYTFQTEKYITESGLDHCNSRLYPKNTSFVTARGTVGKVSLAGIPMAMNQSCYALVKPLIPYWCIFMSSKPLLL